MTFREIICATLIVICIASVSGQRSFSAGVSQGELTLDEQILLNYTLSAQGKWGVINNWWSTSGDRGVRLNFYIDSESSPSISVVIPVACGSGFGVDSDPSEIGMYSSMFFGKAANTSGFTNKFPIPFQRSIVVTYQSSRTRVAPRTGVWLWVRGTENQPILPMYGMPIPPSARLSVQRIERRFDTMFEFVDIVRVPAGQSGLVLATMLTLTSDSPYVLEGCYYMFPDAHTTWESNNWSVLATGTEDYFESAFYWNGGVVAQPYSGATTRIAGPPVQISAYKIHSPLDPLSFTDGFTLKWRIGDLADTATERKCVCPPGATGCTPVGAPRPTEVVSYAWVMTW